jgi:hypothetical protein
MRSAANSIWKPVRESSNVFWNGGRYPNVVRTNGVEASRIVL